MKPLFYILKKSIKNYIKELKKKPVALIGYILFAILLLFIIGYSIVMPSSIVKAASPDIYGTIIGGVILAFTYFSVKIGISRGGTFFRTSDVNLVFTSPIEPRKVLIYGFIKQLYKTLFTMIFFVFQIPNIKNFFPLKAYGGILIILAFFIFTFSLSIVGVLIYSVCAKDKNIRRYFEKGVNLIVALVIILFLIQFMESKDIIQSTKSILNNKYFYYIPFIGWFKGIFMAAVIGINTQFYVNLVLIVMMLCLIIVPLFKLNMDYYEDVLNATEYLEKFYLAKKEGKTLSVNDKSRVRRIKQRYKGTGAKAIFYRQLLEYKKTGFFFVNKGTLLMIIIGTVFGLLLRDKNIGINLILYFTVYMLLFMTMQGKWAQEITKPYIFLIPGNSANKVFYATLADNIKNAVDGFALFIIIGIIFRASPIIIILCALTYMSFGSIYIYGDILSKRILGEHSKNLEIMLKLLITVGIIAPGIIISIVISIVYKNLYMAEYLQYIILILYNLFASFIILFTNASVFENLEMK